MPLRRATTLTRSRTSSMDLDVRGPEHAQAVEVAEERPVGVADLVGRVEILRGLEQRGVGADEQRRVTRARCHQSDVLPRPLDVAVGARLRRRSRRRRFPAAGTGAPHDRRPLSPGLPRAGSSLSRRRPSVACAIDVGGKRVDGGLVEADQRPKRAADQMQLVLDDEVGRGVMPSSRRGARAALAPCEHRELVDGADDQRRSNVVYVCGRPGAPGGRRRMRTDTSRSGSARCIRSRRPSA